MKNQQKFDVLLESHCFTIVSNFFSILKSFKEVPKHDQFFSILRTYSRNLGKRSILTKKGTLF